MKTIGTIFYTIAVAISFVCSCVCFGNIVMIFLCFGLWSAVLLLGDTWFGDKIIKDKRIIVLLVSQLLLILLTEYQREDLITFMCPFYGLFLVLNYFVGKNSRQVFVLNLFTLLIISLNVLYATEKFIESESRDIVCYIAILHCARIVSIISVCLKEILANRQRVVNLAIIATFIYTLVILFVFFSTESIRMMILYFALFLGGFAALCVFCRKNVKNNIGAVVLVMCQLLLAVSVYLCTGLYSLVNTVCGLCLILNFFIGRTAKQVFVLNSFTLLALLYNNRLDTITIPPTVDGETIGVANMQTVFILHCACMISVISLCLKEFCRKRFCMMGQKKAQSIIFADEK